MHEGGISTPLIVHWPAGIRARGELRHSPGHVIDLVPTILDVVGGQPFKTWNDTPVPAAPGHSLVPAFFSDGTIKREDLWWSHEGNRAIRVGDWKLVAAKGSPWELFDLSNDRTETRDLAGTHPDRVKELEQAWLRREQEFIAMARDE